MDERIETLIKNIQRTVAAKGVRGAPERNFTIPPNATDVANAKKAWLERREQVHGLKGVDQWHKCTVSTCSDDGSLEMIDRGTNLYGCTRSGIVHQCRGSEGTCTTQCVSKDGTIVCVFSGAYLGALIDRRNPMCWGKARTGYDLPEANHDNEDGESFCVANETNQGYSPARKIGREARKGVQPRLSENALRDMETVIEDLLYNSNERVRVDSHHKNTMETVARASMRKYYTDCTRARRLPSRHKLENLRCREMTTKPRLAVFPYNGLRVRYYAGLLMHLWTKVQRSPGRVKKSGRANAKCHALGMLYLMQTPFSAPDGCGNQRDLLPKDNFLYWNLPCHGDLHGWKSTNGSRWKYKKGDITKGRNSIRTYVNSVSGAQEREQLFRDMKMFFERAPALTEHEAMVIPNFEGCPISGKGRA